MTEVIKLKSVMSVNTGDSIVYTSLGYPYLSLNAKALSPFTQNGDTVDTFMANGRAGSVANTFATIGEGLENKAIFKYTSDEPYIETQGSTYRALIDHTAQCITYVMKFSTDAYEKAISDVRIVLNGPNTTNSATFSIRLNTATRFFSIIKGDIIFDVNSALLRNAVKQGASDINKIAFQLRNTSAGLQGFVICNGIAVDYAKSDLVITRIVAQHLGGSYSPSMDVQHKVGVYFFEIYDNELSKDQLLQYLEDI